MILEGVSVNRGSIIFLSVAALGLAGCDSTSDAVSDTISDAIVDTESADPARDVASLLERDDPAACANQTAIDTALAAANRDYTSYLENGGQRLGVDTISATAVDKDIHEITCSSVIHYRMTSDKEFSLPFRFKLRPMLGDGPRNFVAEAFGGREAWAAVMWHMAWWNNGRKEHGSNSADPAAGEKPAARENADDGSNALEPDWSPTEANLIKEYSDLNSDCRGSYDPEVTEAACSERDNPNSALKRKLRAANICLGRESDESAADNEFHRCTADSYRF